jgi:hypothetical protein
VGLGRVRRGNFSPSRPQLTSSQHNHSNAKGILQMLTNFTSAIEAAANGRKRLQKAGETRQAYLSRARRACRTVFYKLAADCEYKRCHTSFLVRDTLLVVEQWFPDLGTFGVEYIPAGRGARSPEVTYLNTGDTYELTILYIRGRFRVGCWGDIVERGNYN